MAAKGKSGNYRGQWKPRERRPLVSKHDHVGHMIFTDEDAACRECGQCWELTEHGWRPA